MDLSRLAAEVVGNMQHQSERHRLLLQAPAEAPICADPLRIEQVLTNLLDNAVKFSPEGGPIEVNVDVEPGTARLSVRDHGIGIPPEHRGQIFERFYQAEAAAIKHAAGMGLGLHISRQIVELHHGRIGAEFPPDGGTRFVITLPSGADRDVCGD
jgi:signal transduction histidine kinase